MYKDFEDYGYDFDFGSESIAEWSIENYSYFKTESGTSSKMFISKTPNTNIWVEENGEQVEIDLSSNLTFYFYDFLFNF